MTGTGSFVVRGSTFGVRTFVVRTFVVLAFAPAAPAPAQTVDAAVVYRDNCATCHDAPTGRTPSRDALKDRTPETILNAMTSGTMTMQAMQLSTGERRAVAEYLSGKPFGTVATTAAAVCATKPPAIGNIASQPQWNGFGVDSSNSRYQPKPGMTAADVPNLKLKWAFGFPGGTQAYGNPAIVAGRVFVGSDNGTVYALDAQTGCTHWTFKAEGGVRTAPSVAPIGRKFAVYIGDLKANLFALDAETGAVIWKKSLDTHRFARITGAPVVADGKVYVPVSSTEEAPAAQPNYECCTFRGSVVALDASSGDQLWKSYTITEAPTQIGTNSKGTAQYAPAGAAVWNSPTIDRQKGVLYIGTGNSYTGPAVKTSDSVLAMDLKTGRIVWWNQVTGGDAFLVGCRPGVENCPKELGPDHDFGNAPILRTLPGGKRIIVIGQKSGTVWGLDPDAEGKVLWQFKAGKGGALGGIEWGSAADDTTAYIPVSDVLTPPNEAGGLFALKLTDGQPLWHTPAPKLECNTGRGCTGAQSAPVSVIPGVVFSGSVDGHMRAYSTKDGSILWDFNTVRDYETVNHVPGKGGSIDAAGPAIADGLLVTNSGYALWRGLPGNVLLAFSANDPVTEPTVRVDAVMGEIERDVRARLRRHLLKKGGAADYQDEEIFDAVHALLARAVDGRDLDATLLPELADGDVDWRLQTHLHLTTHRPAAAGRLILFAKKKLLLPLTRWLFEYSQENFRRQDHLNRILFACIEELALENARLRRQIDTAPSASAGKPAR